MVRAMRASSSAVAGLPAARCAADRLAHTRASLVAASSDDVYARTAACRGSRTHAWTRSGSGYEAGVAPPVTSLEAASRDDLNNCTAVGHHMDGHSRFGDASYASQE